MLLSNKMHYMLNKQFNNEIYSAFIYLNLSTYCVENGLVGAQKWFYTQHLEEMEHAMKFYNYILTRGGRVEILKMKAIKTDVKSLLGCFEFSANQESQVTKDISLIMDLAEQERDYASRTFLNLFIEEQVEEEASIQDIICKIKIAGKNNFYLVDQELGTRQETNLKRKY